MNGEVLTPTRPWYWSIRREVWENRSLYLVPLIVGAFVLFTSAMTTAVALPRRIRTFPTLDPAQRHATIVVLFDVAPAVIMMTTLIVGIFYAVDALYGERRDRSILFWKSLPVSDRTTVLSKAAIPMAVLPLIAFVLSVITFYVVFAVGTMVVLASGLSPAPLWHEVRLVQAPIIMLYGLTVHALWFAPIYSLLLLISAWARRMPFLWAFLPPFLVVAFEGLTFRTKHFGNFLRYRMDGAMHAAFVIPRETKHIPAIDSLSQLAPLKFLTTPGLWLGLLFAAACLAMAIRLRRNREPI